MSVDPSDRLAYWKRHFDDQNRLKLEKQLTDKNYNDNPLYETHFRNKVPEENRLTRKSITPSERMIIGLKNELNTYKNLLHKQQDSYDNLLAKLNDKEYENKYYKIKIDTIQKQINAIEIIN
jgi:hypothetical protein